jgi:hypothetical protein
MNDPCADFLDTEPPQRIEKQSEVGHDAPGGVPLAELEPACARYQQRPARVEHEAVADQDERDPGHSPPRR